VSAKKAASEGRLPEALVLRLSMCVLARPENVELELRAIAQLLCQPAMQFQAVLLSDLVQVRLRGSVFFIGDAEFLNRTREESEIEVQAWYGTWSSGGKHRLRQCAAGTRFLRSGFTCQACMVVDDRYRLCLLRNDRWALNVPLNVKFKTQHCNNKVAARSPSLVRTNRMSAADLST
jgi:hypothetical protein